MKFRMPHTLVIVGALVVIVLVLSWVIPSGSYQRVEKDGRKITVPGSYQVVDKHRLGPHWALTAPLKAAATTPTRVKATGIAGGTLVRPAARAARMSRLLARTTTTAAPSRVQKKARPRSAASPSSLFQTSAMRLTAASVSPKSATAPTMLAIAPRLT